MAVPPFWGIMDYHGKPRQYMPALGEGGVCVLAVILQVHLYWLIFHQVDTNYREEKKSLN